MKRTKLADRVLPNYSSGEELVNSVTHLLGVFIGIAVLVLCISRAKSHGNVYGVVGSCIYGASMIALYAVSGTYHGLRQCMAKKVMQVVDHCTIYFLIAGTYTVIVLSAFRPIYPILAWGLFGFEWTMAIAATVLTAIDLRKFRVLSMICYIGLGWAILPFARQATEVLTRSGFMLLLYGGIAYTIGAVLYGIGSHKKWMHSVFHVFVILGSVLQFLCIVRYAI